MPVKRVMKTFNVTKYQVMKGKDLYREKGILALPPVNKGPKTLQENTIKSIISFYENDEFSRIMPGKKDYVSISKNVHQQKRLLLGKTGSKNLLNQLN